MRRLLRVRITARGERLPQAPALATRDVYAGITYIDGPTIGAEAHMSLGGVKATGNGHREGGHSVLWDVTTGEVLWAEGAHTREKMREIGRPFTEVFPEAGADA